jgi:hypothetical protein
MAALVDSGVKQCALAHAGKIGQPIEGPFDVIVSETDAREVARQILSFGHLRRLVEHVAVKYVDQDVKNAASHHLWYANRGGRQRRGAMRLSSFKINDIGAAKSL